MGTRTGAAGALKMDGVASSAACNAEEEADSRGGDNIAAEGRDSAANGAEGGGSAADGAGGLLLTWYALLRGGGTAIGNGGEAPGTKGVTPEEEAGAIGQAESSREGPAGRFVGGALPGVPGGNRLARLLPTGGIGEKCVGNIVKYLNQKEYSVYANIVRKDYKLPE